MVCDDLPNQQLDIDPKNEDVCIFEMTTTIVEVKYVDLGELIDYIFHDTKTTTVEILVLQPHLLSGLKVLRGKQ